MIVIEELKRIIIDKIADEDHLKAEYYQGRVSVQGGVLLASLDFFLTWWKKTYFQDI